MNSLVVGTGSIGVRHARNLKFLGFNVFVFSHSNNSKIENEFHLISKSEVDNKFFDVIVIASITSLHISDAIWLLNKTNKMYIEKPLSNDKENIDLFTSKLFNSNCDVNFGFMLRSHPNIVAIKKFIDSNQLGSIYYSHANVGQYLGDWRPKTDYKKSYSSFIHKGGGVVLDLIHEIDLIHYMFKDFESYISDVSNVSTLNIETEGLAFILFKHLNGIRSSVRLDYVRPVYERKFEIVGENGILQWDYLKGDVFFINRKNESFLIDCVPNDFTRNDMFLIHLESFIKRKYDLNTLKNEVNDVVKIFAIACDIRNLQ
jgi:predicted dehydrogenase